MDTPRTDQLARASAFASSNAFLVPIKSFKDAKERLSGILDAAERAELAQRLAAGVIAAAHPAPVAVVCDDADVAHWSERHGAIVIWTPDRGLNPAVAAGVSSLEDAGATRITVVHADLADPSRLGTIPFEDGITIVPDRHDDGTNVLSVPARSGFKFGYGRGSFDRHRQEAARLGLACIVHRDAALALDVDVPDDHLEMLARTRTWGPEGPHATRL